MAVEENLQPNEEAIRQEELQDDFVSSQIPQNKVNVSFTLGQKVSAGVLVSVIIVILFFGFSRLKKNIEAPFDLFVNASIPKVLSEEEKELSELRNKDTDEDGLNDYDEQYIYQTSPYIQDSDSDGIDDKKEIENGSNPNCPAGQDCGIIDSGSIEVPSQQEVENVPFSQTEVFNMGGGGFSGIGGIEQPVVNEVSFVLPENLPALEIRELLRQAGMAEDVLSQITDEQLVQSYQKALLQGQN